MKKKVNTLANKITIFRIVMIPAIVIGLLQYKDAWVVGLLALSILTDFLDGFAARARGERTRLGSVLDPLADKLLLVSIFMTLTHLNEVDTWVFVVIFSRDLFIVLGWIVILILTQSSEVKPRPLGKATTAAQMFTAFALVIDLPPDYYHIVIWPMIALTVASAVDYILIGEKRLGEWG